MYRRFRLKVPQERYFRNPARKRREPAPKKLSLGKAELHDIDFQCLLLMSLTSVYIHIVFRTKSSVPAISLEHSEKLYGYIWGISKNLGVNLLRINGMEDHIHLFVKLPPRISLSEFVRGVKANSSRWAKESGYFPNFSGWATEYAAFSYSEKDKDVVVNYIRTQREHHKKTSMKEELETLCKEFGLSDKIPYFLKD